MNKDKTEKEAHKILVEMDGIAEKSKLTEKDVKELAEKVDAGIARRLRKNQRAGRENKKE